MPDHLARPQSPATGRLRVALLGAVLAAMALPAGAMASPLPPNPSRDPVGEAPDSSTLKPDLVARVNSPVLAISPPGDTKRLFIVTKGGRIRILKASGTLLSKPFLDLSTKVSKGSEQGLLGLAFHPSFATNRKLYVYFTNTSGDAVIRQYKASASRPNRVASGSGRTILKIGEPFSNHNGGMLAFGRDGYLYIGTGDGGSLGDPGNRAQSKRSLLGKMLRINVNGRTATRAYTIPRSNPYVGRKGRDEIWQRGLRNPWRFSFDRSTGDLWIGDVGQNAWEEVDRARRTSSGPGKGVNWGWRVMEGNHCYNPSSGCDTTGKRKPLTEYAHAGGRCSITGGFVYRGSAIPALRGWYVFGDYCTGEVMAVSASASRPASFVTLLGTGSGRLVSGFGQDASGELYLCDIAGGAVYRLVPN